MKLKGGREDVAMLNDFDPGLQIGQKHQNGFDHKNVNPFLSSAPLFVFRVLRLRLVLIP